MDAQFQAIVEQNMTLDLARTLTYGEKMKR
jgi:hypothetical protein